MSYSLEPAEALRDGVPRLLAEQLTEAAEQLEEQPEGLDKGIHEARKMFKKARALLRLIRPGIGKKGYRGENNVLREAGQLLSPLRDSAVMVETVEKIRDWYGEQLAPQAFGKTLEVLRNRHDERLEALKKDDRPVREAARISRDAVRRMMELPAEAMTADVAAAGLRRTYKRGRTAMARAEASPLPANFHEWRKRAKDLRYHLEVLRPLWPEVLKKWAKEVHVLGDILGDKHDLDVLEELLCTDGGVAPDPTERTVLLALLVSRNEQLQAQALAMGTVIYAEEPKAFAERHREYFEGGEVAG